MPVNTCLKPAKRYFVDHMGKGGVQVVEIRWSHLVTINSCFL